MPALISADFPHPPFRFAILAAGFKPISQEATSGLFCNKIKTASMHMIGDADTLIIPERMLMLADAFENPLLFRHPGG